MLLKLFVLFAVMPIAEIFLIIQVADSIGGWPTFLIVIVTALAGQIGTPTGLMTMRSAQQKLASDSYQVRAIGRIIITMSGVLLVTPGFVTDVIGFICVLPFTRAPLAQFIANHITVGNMHEPFGQTPFGNHYGPSKGLFWVTPTNSLNTKAHR